MSISLEALKPSQLKDAWYVYEPFSQQDNSSTASIASLDQCLDMEASTCICVCLMFFLFMTVGIPCLIVAGQCETAELRANNTALCRLIQSDESAKALETVGWVFAFPFMLALLVAVFCCYALICG